MKHSWRDWPPSRVAGQADADSIQTNGLMRRIQREGRDGDLEAFPCTGLHLIAADHDAGWRGERRARGILETLARRQYGFLADDARPTHFLLAPHSVGNPPMATPKLNGFAALVLDTDLIRPHIVVFRGGGLVLEIERLDGNFDKTRDFRIHGPILRGFSVRAAEDGPPGSSPTPSFWAAVHTREVRRGKGGGVDLAQVAGHLVAGPHLPDRRLFDPAALPHIGAACMETPSRGRIDRARHVALEDDAVAFGLRVRQRNG